MTRINLTAIKTYMNNNNLSEQDMALKMGISYSYLFRVMRGTRHAGGKFISGLVDAGMKVEDIFSPESFPKGKKNQPTGTCN